MNKEQKEFMEGFVNEAVKYVNDPTTDRTYLAQRYLEAMLVRQCPTDPSNWVRIAFELADEFLKQSNIAVKSQGNLTGNDS